MLSRWLRWLVVAPVLLFVFGAILLSCSGSSSNAPTPTPSPGFSLQSIVISTGAPPSPTPSFTPTPPTPTPGKTPSPTLTPRPSASPTNIVSTGPDGVPTGGTIAFNAIGTFTRLKQTKTTFVDITFGAGTLWTSTDNTVLLAPPSGDMGGMFTTGFAGCVCILASSSGVSSQPVAIGVYDNLTTCGPGGTEFLCPTAVPTATATPAPAGAVAPNASSTAAPAARSAGILMWTFDPGSELRGQIAAGPDGSIFFITRDGVLHGVNSAGKETMHHDADGTSPAVLPDGTVVTMGSKSALEALSRGGATLWNLEIGDSAGPLAVTDSAIYASAGGDLLSVSASGSLNWRVNVGAVNSAAATPDGVVVGTSRGAVTAIASDGAVVWSFQPNGGFSGSVAYANDVVYAGSASGGVYALDLRTGIPVWNVDSVHAVNSGPAVAPSGAIFAGSDAIYGVNADGQQQWKNSSLKPGDAGLIVLGDDSVFDAAVGDVGAVLMGDGSDVWTTRSFGKITTATSSPSGMLYVGTSTGRIFAVR
jgi:outer membrane protein assembly factor BamB